jgi:hypothetical protein
MNGQFDPTNKGTLFLEERDGMTKDGKPYKYFSGNLNVEGKEYYLDGYPKRLLKKDGTEVDVINLRVKPKAPTNRYPAPTPRSNTSSWNNPRSY